MKLAGIKGNSEPESLADKVPRTSGFGERPVQRLEREPADLMDVVDAPKRDDRLALIEELELGPYDHTPPAGDPHFKTVEPNSGIRLSCAYLIPQ